jgi:hypothetical protein
MHADTETRQGNLVASRVDHDIKPGDQHRHSASTLSSPINRPCLKANAQGETDPIDGVESRARVWPQGFVASFACYPAALPTSLISSHFRGNAEGMGKF